MTSLFSNTIACPLIYSRFLGVEKSHEESIARSCNRLRVERTGGADAAGARTGEAARAPAIKDPWGLQRTAVSGTTKINRQDFGLTYSPTLDNGGLVVGNEVEITLDVEMMVPAGK